MARDQTLAFGSESKALTTAWLGIPYLHIFRHKLGEGSGTPLQDSCLENPMDGGAW